MPIEMAPIFGDALVKMLPRMSGALAYVAPSQHDVEVTQMRRVKKVVAHKLRLFMQCRGDFPPFIAPNKAPPPPGFSSQERYEQCYSSAAPENLFRGSRLPSQLELRSPRNSGDVEFIDPAILAVGKGILPPLNPILGLGLNSIIPSQFCSTEGNQIQSLTQHSIAAHQDPRFFTSYNDINDGLSAIHNAHISSRFPAQINNNTSYSPLAPHQVRPSNFLNSHYSDWQNVLNDSGMGLPARKIRSLH